jgi:tripartite-type tricarboxylate transporter receptor subunit TctC
MVGPSRWLRAAMRLVLVSGFSFGALAGAHAQADYPTGPVRLIVGYTAGGATDIVARLFGAKLSEQLGKPVVIENRPGAAGTVAIQEFKNMPPDGQALLVVAASHTFYPLTTSKPIYQIEDFPPIALLGVSPNVFATDPKLPSKDLKEFIALLKASPGKYFHGSSGKGSTSHFSSELFRQLAGVDIGHAPFKGSAEAIQNVSNSQIALHMDTLSTALSLHKQGLVKILAIASTERDAGAPEIPTAIEAGLPGMVSNTYYALVAPKRLPQPVMDKVAKASQAAIASPDFQSRMKELMIRTSDASPAATLQFMNDEMKTWSEVAKKGNLKID